MSRHDPHPIAPFDPRTVDMVALLRACRVDDFEPFSQFGANDGLQSLTPEFLAHARTLYVSGGGRSVAYVAERPANRTANQTLNGLEVDNYAHHVLSARMAEMNAEDVTALIDLIVAPTGWTRTVTRDVYEQAFWGETFPSRGCVSVKLTSLGGDAYIVFNVSPVTELKPYALYGTSVTFSGHTTYRVTKEDGKHAWYSRSRRGLDDSFYGGDLSDPVEIVAKQLAWIEESRARTLGLVAIPGTRWSVTPAELVEIRAKLADGRSHSFVPAGMGTGEQFTLGRRASYARRADAATEAFLGSAPLWVEFLDCD